MADQTGSVLTAMVDLLYHPICTLSYQQGRCLLPAARPMCMVTECAAYKDVLSWGPVSRGLAQDRKGNYQCFLHVPLPSLAPVAILLLAASSRLVAILHIRLVM